MTFVNFQVRRLGTCNRSILSHWKVKFIWGKPDSNLLRGTYASDFPPGSGTEGKPIIQLNDQVKKRQIKIFWQGAQWPPRPKSKWTKKWRKWFPGLNTKLCSGACNHSEILKAKLLLWISNEYTLDRLI